ncbi:MAG: hypothetical protein R3F11_06080 [Verrucomicrobiales bacterium]
MDRFWIGIFLHWTFWLLIAWVVFLGALGGGGIDSVLYSLALIAGVFLRGAARAW